MLARSILSAAALAGVAVASPIQKRDDNIDGTVLRLALTLEHFENVFYKTALQNFTEDDFVKAGYSANYYNNLKYISYDEQEHVKFIETALTAAGITPDAPCTYTFPYTDVVSFITLSSVLEGVGTSAYLGAAGLITDKNYLTAAGSILVVEAEHTSYQRAAVGKVPIANPFGTPLDPTSSYSLAAAFITSCPPGNKPLGFTAFPTLVVKDKLGTAEEPSQKPSDAIKRSVAIGVAVGGGGSSYKPDNQDHPDHSDAPPAPCPGQTITVTCGPGHESDSIPEGSFVTFVSGLAVVSVEGTVKGSEISAVIPKEASGQVYVFVTKSKITSIVDSEIVAGPAIVEVAPAPPAIDYNEA
ncbi:Ferritin-like domain [Teratosphaeria destructans]|uniref:Ferritin-like domain n=1 Tax=Teratosphaeria destructans TaxID=418781 RepID=A0A9W7VZR0_9PEZI|nr:Ferritin-like domain [Teratosphaeria destructans]